MKLMRVLRVPQFHHAYALLDGDLSTPRPNTPLAGGGRPPAEQRYASVRDLSEPRSEGDNTRIRVTGERKSRFASGDIELSYVCCIRSRAKTPFMFAAIARRDSYPPFWDRPRDHFHAIRRDREIREPVTTRG